MLAQIQRKPAMALVVEEMDVEHVDAPVASLAEKLSNLVHINEFMQFIENGTGKDVMSHETHVRYLEFLSALLMSRGGGDDDDDGSVIHSVGTMVKWWPKLWITTVVAALESCELSVTMEDIVLNYNKRLVAYVGDVCGHTTPICLYCKRLHVECMNDLLSHNVLVALMMPETRHKCLSCYHKVSHRPTY
jgi:hypothetical protein